MDLEFWWEAFDSAIYLLNRLPTHVLNHISPFESFYKQKPDYQFLKVFGCACFPYLQPYNRHRLTFKTSKCLFLGYSPFHKGYKCLHPTGRIYIARSVNFSETSFPYQSLLTSSSSLNAPHFAKTYGAPACVLPHIPATKSSCVSPSLCSTLLSSKQQLGSSPSPMSTHAYNIPCIFVPICSPSVSDVSSSSILSGNNYVHPDSVLELNPTMPPPI